MRKLKCLLLGACLFSGISNAQLHSIFPLPASKVEESAGVQIVKLDGVDYALKSSPSYSVRCQAFRGRDRYFVEISVENKTNTPAAFLLGNTTFEKPGFLFERADVADVAREYMAAANETFQPQPAPYIPATVTTTVTSSGDAVTARTTVNDSGQAQANVAASLANMVGAHSLHKLQAKEVVFANFLLSHRRTRDDGPIAPASSRTVVDVFTSYSTKKAPFYVHVWVGAEMFNFAFKG